LFYTVYKITNTVNGKFYIGKHQTKDLDDGYFGSGKLLKRAIEKYGKDAFVKEIIKVCSSEKEMDLVEKILVVPDPEISYNLCNGGQGGWSYVNRNGLQKTEKQKKAAKNHINKIRITDEWILNTRKRHLKVIKTRIEKNTWNTDICTFRGKTHSEETKKRIGLKNKKLTGKRNGSFGTCWITNGQVNKKIKKDELDIWLEKGYYKGRI
jgi:hypothetical protein